MDIRLFAKKNQYKVFMEIEDQNDASKFFKKFFKTPKISLIDSNGQKMFDREMRAYLVKEEATFERYAMEKQVEDAAKRSSDGSKQDPGRGTPSSIGSFQKDIRGQASSYNNSSDDSIAQIGSSSQRGGGGKKKKGQERSHINEYSRNNSAENILQTVK